MYVCAHMHTHTSQLEMHACMRLQAYSHNKHIRTCMHAYIHTCIRAAASSKTGQARASKCIAYIYTYIHTCIHTYIHTYGQLQAQAQDKLEHLNASLRAIETSASAVATEQVCPCICMHTCMYVRECILL